MSRRWLKGTQFLIIPHTRTHLYLSMYLTAAQRLINFVCSVCHVRWARGCPRQHICSKYLKNRWRYHGKLKKNATPRDHRHTHVPPFFVYRTQVHTYLMLGVTFTICITISAYYLRELSVLLYIDVTHVGAQTATRLNACVRSSDASCAAGVYI